MRSRGECVSLVAALTAILPAVVAPALAGCGSHAEPSVATTPAAIARPRPRIVAHRGASGEAPENTHAAFRRAWALGVECVELDVRLTRDGEVVVFHDATTARTGGIDRPVAAQTLAELRALDLGAWFGSAFAGERIATLAEVLAEVPRGATLFVEIKSEALTAPAVAAVIRRADLASRGAFVALQAYDAEALAALAAELPGVPTFWDVDPVDGRYDLAMLDTARARGFTGLALDARAVDDALVSAIRGAGLQLDVWTVNTSAELAAWAARPPADVRWIETDRPDLAPAPR